MSRLQLSNSFEGAEGAGDIAKAYVVIERLGIGFTDNTGIRQYGLGLRTEEQPGTIEAVEERFLAEAIARKEQKAFGFVPDSEGEIPEQVFDAALAPDVVGVQDQFHIGDVPQVLAPVGRQFANEGRPVIDALGKFVAQLMDAREERT